MGLRAMDARQLHNARRAAWCRQIRGHMGGVFSEPPECGNMPKLLKLGPAAGGVGLPFLLIHPRE